MALPFQFEHSVSFSPENAPEILRAIPVLPGVFALHGPREEDQPYLTHAADLRRRITRILAPPDSQYKRLNLRDRVARIEYSITGSEFESTLTLYHAAATIFGLDEARRRLKLRTPFFLRFTAENAYPRVYSTNRLSKRALDNFYGPFPSRAAADRYCDAVLDLFKLRRCVEDLAPYPEHPGCVYQEMKKCLAPCNQACTPEGAAAYTAEAAAVHAFFATHGESMLAQLTADREQASAEMEFERAAQLHAQFQKVKAAASLADELVHPIPKLRAIVVQKSTQPSAQSAAEAASLLSSRSEAEGSASPGIATEAGPAAAIFLLQSGCITGPARLSTLGVRAVKEQTSVGSSLYAQPLMLEAVPLADDPQPAAEEPQPAPMLSFRSATEESASPATATESPSVSPALSPELRATNLIASLEQQASAPTDLATLSDHLSLLRRWYYRPEKQRTGEVFFPRDDSAAAKKETNWPIRRILRGAARMALGEPKPIAETQRDLATRNPEDAAQMPTRTKILHEGRPDVERVVPIIEAPSDRQPAFKSRRKP
jgi:excinuclease ABC subunit C